MRKNRTFAQQKAALTRLQNKLKSYARDDIPRELIERVKEEIRLTMAEWDSRQPPFNYGWPDDWARWQRALNDLPGELWTEMRDL